MCRLGHGHALCSDAPLSCRSHQELAPGYHEGPSMSNVEAASRVGSNPCNTPACSPARLPFSRNGHALRQTLYPILHRNCAMSASTVKCIFLEIATLRII